MRRCRTEIALDILKVAIKGIRKSQIVSEANVNINIASDYLEMLKDKELTIREKDSSLLLIRERFSTK